jgi:hypothetical protein
LEVAIHAFFAAACEIAWIQTYRVNARPMLCRKGLQQHFVFILELKLAAVQIFYLVKVELQKKSLNCFILPFELLEEFLRVTSRLC